MGGADAPSTASCFEIILKTFRLVQAPSCPFVHKTALISDSEGVLVFERQIPCRIRKSRSLCNRQMCFCVDLRCSRLKDRQPADCPDTLLKRIHSFHNQQCHVILHRVSLHFVHPFEFPMRNPTHDDEYSDIMVGSPQN